MHFILLWKTTLQIRAKCAYVKDFIFMIHSKENSQLVHCLCGILVPNKGEQMDNEIRLQSATENIRH